MLDTSQWPTEDLDVLKEVHLDPSNVRLEDADAKVEADIIGDLFANENALGLVEGICSIGYLTHETPIVLKRHGKYVVVEGNRRLAALKAIQNPMLAPDFSARISALAASLPDRSALATLRVMVAPSQTEADQLVAAIHTSNLRKPWSPARQAAFFRAQVDSGRTLKDLLDRYPTIDVRKFVFRAHIINLFKSVDYDDAEIQDFLATKKWAKGLSTLARIHESKDFLELTGLSMDANGIMSKSISDAAFKGVATVIIRGMHEGSINTRSLNSVKSPRYTQLMQELNQVVSSTDDATAPTNTPSSSDSTVIDSATGKVAVTSLDSPTSPPIETSGSGRRGNASASATKADPSRNKEKPSRKKQRYLDLSQIRAPKSYPEPLRLLLGELSAIDVQKFPNGTFLMIRAALERSIKAFAEAKSADIRSTGNNRDGRVQLSHALNWLLSHVKDNGPKHLTQVIEGVRTGRLVTYTNSADSLNAVNHNHHFMVDPDQALSMWASIDSLMRYLMKP